MTSQISITDQKALFDDELIELICTTGPVLVELDHYSLPNNYSEEVLIMVKYWSLKIKNPLDQKLYIELIA